MTFDATVNPVRYEGGDPVFIDTEYDTWNILMHMRDLRLPLQHRRMYRLERSRKRYQIILVLTGIFFQMPEIGYAVFTWKVSL